MTISSQHKTSYVNLGRIVVMNILAVEEKETLLFETTHPNLGGAMWRILEDMAVDYRKKAATHDDFPITMHHGYEHRAKPNIWSISSRVGVWTFTEEVEGFFELCDILAPTEDHQEEGQLGD